MALHDPGPYFIEILYAAAGVPHTMRRSTKDWVDPADADEPGTFDTWNGGSVAADEMIQDFVELLLPFYAADTEFLGATLFHVPVADGPANPVRQFAFTGAIGTDVSASWAQAVQISINMRTQSFNQMRVVLLDAVSGNDFSKQFAPNVNVAPLVAMLINGDKGWAGADNARPFGFESTTLTLNEKLRRAYHMD